MPPAAITAMIAAVIWSSGLNSRKNANGATIAKAGSTQKPGAISKRTRPRLTTGRLRDCICGWLRMNRSAPVMVMITSEAISTHDRVITGRSPPSRARRIFGLMSIKKTTARPISTSRTSETIRS